MFEIETDDSQIIRKQMLSKGIEFLEKNNFRLGFISWESAIRNGDDLPDVHSINKYFGNWAVFNSIVRNTYRNPDFEFNPSDKDLKGYNPTIITSKEQVIKPWKPKPPTQTLETKLNDSKTKPTVNRATKKPFRIPDKRLKIDEVPEIPTPIKPIEFVIDTTNTTPKNIPEKAISSPAENIVDDSMKKVKGKKQYRGTDLKEEASNKKIARPALIIGVGAAAALMTIYFGTGLIKIEGKDVTPTTNTIKPTEIKKNAPIIKNNILKELGLQIKTQTIEDPRLPEQESYDHIDESVFIPAIYRRAISRIRNSKPKSLVDNYNLSPDAKNPISIQGLINTAFYEGTREYADDVELHWNGGFNTVAQVLLAERWLRKYTGTELENLEFHREEEFSESFINASKVELELEPAYKDKAKKAQSNTHPVNTDSYEEKNTEQKEDKNKKNITGQLQFIRNENKIIDEYSEDERELISHLYAEMRFGKNFSENAMHLMGQLNGIAGLTADLAEDIYFEQKSGVNIRENSEDGSIPLDYTMFNIKAA